MICQVENCTRKQCDKCKPCCWMHRSKASLFQKTEEIVQPVVEVVHPDVESVDEVAPTSIEVQENPVELVEFAQEQDIEFEVESEGDEFQPMLDYYLDDENNDEELELYNDREIDELDYENPVVIPEVIVENEDNTLYEQPEITIEEKIETPVVQPEDPYVKIDGENYRKSQCIFLAGHWYFDPYMDKDFTCDLRSNYLDKYFKWGSTRRENLKNAKLKCYMGYGYIMNKMPAEFFTLVTPVEIITAITNKVCNYAKNNKTDCITTYSIKSSTYYNLDITCGDITQFFLDKYHSTKYKKFEFDPEYGVINTILIFCFNKFMLSDIQHLDNLVCNGIFARKKRSSLTFEKILDKFQEMFPEKYLEAKRYIDGLEVSFGPKYEKKKSEKTQKELETEAEAEKKKTPAQKLKEAIDEIAIDNGYLRTLQPSFVIYKPSKIPFQYEVIYTSAEQFINDELAEHELFGAITSSIHKELVFYLTKLITKSFPLYKGYNYNLIGFKSGFLNLKDCNYYLYENCPANITHRVTRKYIDIEFNPDKKTPNVDKILKAQFNDEMIEFIYFCFGRTLTRIEDRFDFCLFITGASGCGKSVLLNLIKYSYECTDLGLISNSFEPKFGLSQLVNTQLITSDDVANMAKTVEKADFLSMCSNGAISCAVKNKAPIKVDRFDIPMIFNSNYALNYHETANEISRRTVIIKFEKLIKQSQMQTNLEKKILKKEIDAFLFKCRKTYLEYKDKYKNKTVMSFLPDQAQEYASQQSNEQNFTTRFASCCLENEKDNVISIPDLNKFYRGFLNKEFSSAKNPISFGRATVNIAILMDMFPDIEIKQKQYCHACGSSEGSTCCSLFNRKYKQTKKIIIGLGLKPDFTE